ncbi:MAG: efflux RND transporter periplasmic adaptor subunit, partial [Acetobacteraceae bacterium]
MLEEATREQAAATSARHRPRLPAPAVLIVGLLFVAMIGLSIWYLSRREPLVVQGEVQSRTFDMAARVDGRIGQIVVARSQNVSQGDRLILIDDPELVAKEKQSEANLRVADAELARVKAGFRAETIAVRKAEVDRAAADLSLAQKTFDRTRQLVTSHDSPQSQYDKDSAALTLAERTLDQARFAYNEAVAGFTREDLNIALAKVDSAQADVDTLKALVNQMAVVAPADSQVFRIPVENGEFVLPGVPLITLVDLSDMWVQFDLREDLLRDLKP